MSSSSFRAGTMIETQRIARRRNRVTVPLRLSNVGDTGHANGGIHDAREPGQGKNRPGNPVKVMHSAQVLPIARATVLNGRKFHPVKQYGRGDDHRDDRQHERCLQGAFIGHVTHESGRGHIAEQVKDEDVYRQSRRANVRPHGIDYGGIQRRSIEQ